MLITRLFILLFLLLFISNCEKSSTLESDPHKNGTWELVRPSQGDGFYHSIHFLA